MKTTIQSLIAQYKAGHLSGEQVARALADLKAGQAGRPLSAGQQGLWILQKSYPGMTAYNIPVCVRVAQLDAQVLRDAMGWVVRRHPILSTRIRQQSDGRLLQWEEPEQPVPFHVHDLSRATEAEVIAALRAQARQVFAVEDAPLAAVHVFALAGGEAIVLLLVHHLVFDGASGPIVLDALFSACETLRDGGVPALPVAAAGFHDFVRDEQRRLAEGQAALAYWQARLAGPLPVLQLARQSAPVRDAFAGATHMQLLAQPAVDRIVAMAESQGSFLSSLLLAAYKVLLAARSGQRDLVVGMPVNERRSPALQHAVGFLVNMVPIRSVLNEELAFGHFLAQVQKDMIDAMAHSHPFGALVRALGSSPSAARSPVFQTAFMFQDVLQGIDDRPYELVGELHQEGEYELSLELIRRRQGLVLNWKYHPELYSAEDVAALAAAYERVLEAVAGDAGRPLRELFALTGERGAPQAPAHWVHEQVEAQAQSAPDRVAVSFGDQALSYRELSERSTRLASQLRAQGVKKNDLVAVLAERSLDMVVGLLAVLKAGAAYVPLDPAHPADRLAYVVQDSGARVVLAQAALHEQAQSLLVDAPGAASVMLIDGPVAAPQSPQSPQSPQEPVVLDGEDLAYVIYTSGSTGRPKGVMVPHRALANFLTSMMRRPGLGANDVLLAVTTISFDIAGLELWLPLVQGARCHVADAATVRDASQLMRCIQQVRPTVMQATPALWTMLFLAGWRNAEGVRALCGGEAMPASLKQRFVETNTQAWNMYGPTETTIWSTVAQVHADRPVCLGEPIGETVLHVLDDQLRPVAEGGEGELCIAGAGVARGYWNRPELTAQKFIEHPLVPGGRLYRTGDLVRLGPGGSLEYLGRMDFQVKIRGHRVELGEVEHPLLQRAEVQECVAVARGADGERQLVAYCVPRAGAVPAFQPAALRAWLRERLPHYMVPDLVVAIDRIPLTANGKVDRQALMQRPVALGAAPMATPPAGRQALEARLLELWCEVLHVDGVELDDPFFDAGGNSMNAVVLADRITAAFGVPFTAGELFKHPTVSALAAWLQQALPAYAGLLAAVCAAAPAAGPAHDEDSVAVIGISCQFPGAPDLRAFWRSLCEGRQATRFLDEAQLREAQVPERLIGRPGYVPMQLGLADKDCFDAEFFKLSPNHVEMMDPQFRQVLQQAWKAVEDAGLDHRDIPRTAVYVSVGNHGYRTEGDASPVIEDSQQYLAWVLNQSGSVAAMISYQLGLEGPSLSVHSNCSSSLSALDLAFKSVRSGATDFALVAAASARSAERFGYVHQPGLNFSSDGRVKTFDVAADGMVGGEGVAALLLCRTGEAMRRRSHVYGLLRGIASTSDGGQSPGFFSPSMQGQGRAIRQVLQETGIDPSTIGYVEAHGTGTKLGDPVEVGALTEAYREHTVAQQFCGIGSVKPNIGHLDTAAGLAGCIKVLLSLHHRQLPPSINFSQPNPRLALQESPFYVTTTLAPWTAGDTPRRAALNSIGIGGSNTHAIFEEFVASAAANPVPRRTHLVPLSARRRPNLLQYAGDLLERLAPADGAADAPRIEDIAFTLQRGRVAMPSRVAFVVDDVAQLALELAAFVDGRASEHRFEGEALSRAGSAGQEGDVPAAADLLQLAQGWVAGEPLSWPALHDTTARRVSLPTYPFSRTRHPWAGHPRPEATGAAAPVAGGHPLMQGTCVGDAPWRFHARLSGEEFVVRDHVVLGRRLLPAVGALEMAFEALRRSMPQPAGPGHRLVLKHLSWLRPVAFDGAEGLALELSVQWEAASGHAPASATFELRGQGAQPVVHMQGRAQLHPATSAPRVDLAALRSRMSPQAVDGQACYAHIRRVGIDYGTGFRVIDKLHRSGPSAPREVLAELRLPQALAATMDEYTLHPSLMDAAIHASVGLEDALLAAVAGDAVPVEPAGAAARTAVPFALDSFEYFAPFQPRMQAWVRSDAMHPDEQDARVLDIDLLDMQGRTCARLRGLAFRPLGAPADGVAPRASVFNALQPAWLPLPASPAGALAGDHDSATAWLDLPPAWAGELRAHPAASVALPANISEDEIRDHLARLPAIDHLVWFAPPAGLGVAGDLQAMRAAQAHGLRRLFRIVKAVLALGHGKRGLTWTVITFGTQAVNQRDAVDPTHAGVHGLMGSLAKEYGQWRIRLLDLPADASPSLALPALPDRQSPVASGETLALRDGRWHRQRLLPVQALPEAAALPQCGSVQVVVGGAGGIGEVWSRFMVERHQAGIVWIGRRAADEAIVAKLQSLAELARRHGAPEPMYVPADAADLASLREAHRTIRQRHARVDGVVHSAIVLADRSVAHMDEQRLQLALAPKVDASIHLAEVFAEEPLQQVLFFSSLEGFARSPGQANYAAGCTFKDAFAQALARVRGARAAAAGLPAPAVKTVHWGYWGTAGVVSDAAYRQRMASAGIDSLDPRQAMEQLERFVASGFGQLAFVQTFGHEPLQAWCGDEQVLVAPAAGPSVLQACRAATPPRHEAVAQLLPALPQPRMLDLSRRLLAATLRDIAGDGRSLRVQGGLLPKYQRWFDESRAELQRSGLMLGDGTGSPEAFALRTDDLWTQWHAARPQWVQQEFQRGQVDLLERCLAAMPEVLAGRRPATDVLFPGGSTSAVEAMYRHHPVVDHFNLQLGDLAAQAVAAWRQHDPARRVRILEVGAGTGASTRRVLQALRPLAGAIEEYCFTDVSKAFLFAAQERLAAEHPFLRTRLFDVSRPGQPQGVAPCSYDIVIATNVLHATPDVARTLRHVKATMRRQGLLLLNEMSSNALLSHLTFGLLDGWWACDDTALRLPGGPLLAPARWIDLLADAGLAPGWLPHPEAHALGQQVIVAESDGIVRLPHEGMPAAMAPAAMAPAAEAGTDDAALLRTRTQAHLGDIVARALKLEQVDPQRDLAEYGLDSILVANLNNALAQDFDDLPSTLFFEMKTIDALVDYFVVCKRPALMERFGLHERGEAAAGQVAGAPLQDALHARLRRVVCEVLKMSEAELAPERNLFDCGLDSILVTQLNNRLAGPFEGLGSTLFFDCPTIAAATEHLLQHRAAEVVAWVGATVPATAAASPATLQRAAAAAAGVCAAAQPARPAASVRSRDVAIVGLAGHFPGAQDVQQFWSQVRDGVDCVSAYPADRWWCPPRAGEQRWGGFLRDVACFDAAFFGIDDTLAALLDPQERLFIETTYHAIEDAGYTPATLADSRRVGVFVGVMNATYSQRVAYSSIANRTSYLFDFQGTSLAVDSACSSSLTAIHLALESLYSGDNDCAIAGGVNLILDLDHFDLLSEMKLLSAGRECRAFGERADGFVAAEGVGSVVLRPLDDALARGDQIHGVIKASAVNAGGRSNRYGVPNLHAQRALVERALDKAGIDPATIGYVEAHGTATLLGDSIEVSALGRAYDRAGRRPRGSCPIGSVKSNIGHCESASGMAGLIKVLMQMKHGQIAPSLHAEELNSGIVFGQTPFFVNRSLAPWPAQDAQGRAVPRRAAVSCFGAGGANAHLLVEQHVAPATGHAEDPADGAWHAVPLSARHPERLRELARRLLALLRQGGPVPALRDVAYTLQVGREALPVRAGWLVRSIDDLCVKLAAFIDGDASAPASDLRQLSRSSETERRWHAEQAACIERHDMPGLLALWLQGAEASWQAMVLGPRPRRVSLPGYPFEKTVHWHQPPQGGPARTGAGSRAAAEGRQPSRSSAPAAPLERVRAWLAGELGRGLGIEAGEIDAGRDFVQSGLSSQALVQLAREIRRKLEPDFDAATLFEHATLDRLASHLVNERGVDAASLDVDDTSPEAGVAPEVAGRHPLSQGQQGLWMLQKTHPATTAYHVPLCLRARDLDTGLFAEAFAFALRQHPALDVVVAIAEGRLVQQACGQAAGVPEHDARALDEPQVLERIRRDVLRPFDLERGPLCRAAVYRLGDGSALVLIEAHHVVIDGASLAVLVGTLEQAYDALAARRQPQARPEAASHADFVAEEARLLASGEGQRRLAHWRRRLEGAMPLALHTDHPRRAAHAVHGRSRATALPVALGEALRRFCEAQALYPSTVFLALFQVLLRHYTQQEDVVVGMPASGRPGPRFERTVGYFVNMVPVRSQVAAELGVQDFCRALQRQLAQDLACAYPLPALVRELGLAQADGSAPLFNVAFMVQDWHEDRSSAAARFEHLPGVQQQGEYDLVLEVVLPAQASQPIVLNWKYDPGLFEDETLARLHRHFAVLLEMVMQRPDTPVAACELVCAEERLGLVRDRNRTEVAYPAHMTTASLFAAQAQRTPQAPAIVFGEQALRYGELHARVERLAAGLRRRGVGPGRLVAVCMERCTDLVAALLGVLQAGGAYIPLDPGYPRERLVDILGDARPQVVLTQQALQASVRGMCRDAMDGRDDVVVAMDGEWIEPASQAGTDARLAATPDDLAYVIYTSGSTGRPKGVMVSHRALTNFLCSMAREPGLAATDRLLAVTTHSFDIAALELFLPLVAGAVCHIADAATVKDAQRLKSLVEAVRPTVMQATPSAWSMLLHAGWRDGQGLRILCGGEAMSEPLKDRLLATGAEVWNMFGPTETTVWSLVERVQPGKPVSIGTPIANTRVYVVDPQGRLSPSGVPGELCIAGDGLARGYLNRPELSAEKFCADPFVPGASMYRTGDLVRWAPDGSLQYLGRMDSQVKVRGFRIELAEIETLLLAHPAVRDGAVVARAQGENKLLVAYYTPEGDGADGAQALQQHLAGRLPDYMVPAFFIQLEALPCTPNGKVDRKSLSERPLRLHGDADAPASTPAPMAPAAAVALDEVLGLWREVLMVEDIRASDGFFDAGGSSVLAAVLAERIAQRFGVVFTATDVFRHPTAAQVHARLNALRAVPAAACRTAPAARASVPFAQELQSTQGAPGMQDAQGARAPAHASGAAADASATGLQGAVAIVGLSCEVPGARNHRAFWRNLLAGHESVTLYTADELHERGVAPWLAAHPRFVPVQSTMAGKAFFDAEFFGISARDAELMDPQARLLLQNAWKAVEDAGYLAEDIADAAVYLSASNSHYLAPLVHDLQHKDSETLVRFMLSQPGTFAAMVSHHLRLKGPSLFVHSNCSSSLAALALGCQAIASGQVRHALVGGASIYAHDSIGYLHEEGMNLSADGHCRAFDAQASGMVGGEGVAVVLLKDAAAALADGDAIYAIVRGAAINNDGGDKAGFYAPSVAGQTAVIRSALARAGVDASTVQYVEAHGTGTRLGDPIEVSALAEAYRDARAVGLGSVKSNLGHLDAAAGLAGLVKCALALREGQVPPSIHFRTPNPQARFEATPFQVLDRVTPLRSDGGPARAAVSSFGIGGTNVHAVLEAAPAVGGGAQAGGARLVPLSARKPANLRCMARELADELQRGMDSGTAPRLADVAFTLQVGRLAQPVRAAFVVHELPELVAALRGLAGGHDAMAPPQSLAEAGLLDDEDRQQLVQRWISAGRLDKLARFWQAGGTVHWARLHGPHDRPRRVNLPAYAFSEDAHWIAREVQPVSAAQDTMVKPSEATLFEERWVEAPLPEGVQVAAAQGRRERIVCLFDDATGRQHLRQALQALNPQAELLFLAQDPSAGAEAGCLAVEGGEHGLDTALQTVARDGAQVDAVYWLGPVQDAGCLHDLAFPGVLLRALQRAGLSAGQVLLAGSFTDAVEQALLDALVGYERSVARAWPGSVVRVLMHAGTATPEQWVHLLHRELHHGGHASVMVRDGRRLACRVRPMDGAAPGTGFAFKRGGTYVVTGAFRGLGRRVAEHLARRYQAKLVLLGRSVPGEKELAWIAGLADAGCEVQHASVDVADLQALQAVHAALPPAWRQVDGVLHVAGVDQPASLLEQDAAAFERVLRPKVPGTLALERVFGAQGQALMCAFSSSAAVQGDFGGCDYAVANRFQWAYARALREWQGEGSRMVAIGWPLWEEGGMGAATRQRLQPQALQAYLAASGQAPLPTRTALALLERLLGEGHVQPLVINADPVRAGALLKSTGGMAPAVAGPAVAAPVGDPLQQALAAELHSLAQQLLKQPEQALDEDRPFVDLGFDSIRLMQLATRMSERLGVKLLPALFYDHPTIGQIAGHVAAVHAEALAARWPAAALRAPQEPASAPAGAGQDGTAPPAPASSPSKEHATALHEPIAIIGMSGLFPQADSVPAFWQMVAGQQHAVGPVPAARWGWHAADSTSELRCRWMGCLDAVDAFDAQFFEIAPKEARVMDPRQRLLLQEAWKALDDAALGPQLLGERRVGVFVGVEQGDYQYLVQDGGNVTSNHDGVLAARLSYFLDFKGPVMALNTACSSGLVALHQACMSLRQGECDIAVVAAANLLCTPGAFVAMDRAGMLSPSGRCRTFDRHADGMVPGEAVVALVLEPLARAQAEGDPVHSVVVASAINCDGRTNGITAPAGPAQQALLEDIYVRQGVDPAGIGLVVAHGTGTRLGDPVEVQALNAVFGPRMPPGARCALASTKTHVGHTFAASGLVSLAALSQALAHGVLPASLHCEEESDYIEWRDSPFYVNKKAGPWPTAAGRRRMGGVSAFGMSGTNAHVVLAEAPAPAALAAAAALPAYLLPVSAKTEAALERALARLAGWLQETALRDEDLARLSHTLWHGRHHFRHRSAIIASSVPQALQRWSDLRAGQDDAGCFRASVDRSFKPSAASHEAVDALLAQAGAGSLPRPAHEAALAELARWYVQGHPIDAARLHPGRPLRLRLPAYPFAADRHWVDDRLQATRDAAAPATAADAALGHSQPAAVQADSRVASKQPLQRRPTPHADESAPMPQAGKPARQPLTLADPATSDWPAPSGAAAPGAKPTGIGLSPLPEAPTLTGGALRPHDVLEDLKSAADIGFGGMVATLNRTGVMVECLIPYSSDFADYAGHGDAEVLDLGCAYGVATIAALECGARVMAVDMAQAHLDILAQRVSDEARCRLSLMQGVLPDIDFEPGRFAAIHASRVLHFLRPQDVQLTLRKMFSWLKPGGRIFLSSDSPYFGYWAAKATEYEQRKRQGDPWPGFIDDVQAHFPPADVMGGPNQINALDPDVFTRECEAAGFVVERADFFGAVGVDRQAHLAPGPDMEHAGVIAVKPAGRREPPAGPRFATSRDGNAVRLEVRGSGETALVFIHGLGCDGSYWDAQVQHFASRHTVLCLDLAGHGGSGRERARWTVQAFADDVAAAIEHAGLKEVIVVGHSLGGPVMLELPARVGARVRGLVGVDTLHNLEPRPMDPARLDAWLQAYLAHPLDLREMFAAGVDPALVERVRRTRAATGAEVIHSAMREMILYMQALPPRLPGSLTLINSSGWMPTSLDTARRRGVTVELLDGVGHFPMLEAPQALNALIEKAIRPFLKDESKNGEMLCPA